MIDNFNPTIDQMLLLQRELQDLQYWLVDQAKRYTQYLRRGRKFARKLLAEGNDSWKIDMHAEFFDPHNNAMNDLAGMVRFVDEWIDDYVDELVRGGGSSLFREMREALFEAEHYMADPECAERKGSARESKAAVFSLCTKLREAQRAPFSAFSGDGPSNEDTAHFENHYVCSCGASWKGVWSCACNDRCPECGVEVEPQISSDLNE